MTRATEKNVAAFPTVTRMAVTPETAAKWLECNSNNRRISEAHVARLARDMKQGQWLLTHEGIAFDPNGVLLDGQHRLWAIIEAEVPVEMHVWFSVQSEAMMSIDSGKTRNVADVLSLTGSHGHVTRNDLATLRTMLGGMRGSVTLTPAEAAAGMTRHVDAIRFALHVMPNAKYISNADTRAVVARAYYSVPHDRLEAFATMLVTGVVPDGGLTSVIILRQYLQGGAGWSHVDRRDRYAKTERALVAFLDHDPISKLYASTSEQFPLPEEVNG